MTTKKSISRALKTITQGSEPEADPFSVYKKAYDETIKRIENQLDDLVKLAKDAIAWMTHAQRPLKTEELLHEPAVEEEEDDLDEENLPVLEDIVSACAGLVTIDEGSGVVRLIHYTTQEYLKRTRAHWLPEARVDIASTLIRYVSFSSFRSDDYTNRDDIETAVKDHALLDYAARFWNHHAKLVEDQIGSVARLLLDNPSSVQFNMQVLKRIFPK
jgi:hypothetical protein